MGCLVIFDDDKASNKAENRGDVQDTMNISALFLLFWRMCRLEYKDSLSSKEDASGVKKLG